MPVPRRDATLHAPRRLLTDDVFERLRDDIVRGRLSPGQQIHDVEMASRLGLSRATVRTALLRLTDIGLVEAVPNLYTRVTLIDFRRYLETQDTARALYLFAARFGTPALSDDQIAELLRGADRLGARTAADGEAIFAESGLEGFFGASVDAMDNAPLRRTIERLWPTVQRVLGQYAALLPIEEIDEIVLNVIAAASRRDVEGTTASLSAYFDGPLDLFHQRLRSRPEFSPS